MYKVTVVAVNEVMEAKVDAKHCIVDNSNNLIFFDKMETAKPLAMFPASRWICVIKAAD